MSLRKWKIQLGLPVAAAGLLLSGAVQAVGITDVVVDGPSISWCASAGLVTPCVTPAQDLLENSDAAAPGGNVELNKFGGVTTPATPVTTLTGKVGIHDITLSSLTLADWTANGNALAESYVTDAASSVGVSLTAPELATIVSNFFTLPLGVYNPWMLVSDPNVAYVNLENGTVNIGLQGFLNAGPVLEQLFLGVVTFPPDFVAQASEVVKVTYGGTSKYLYGFNATPTNQVSVDPTNSFDGNYEVTIPNPAPLALLLVGVAAMMKRRTA